MEQVAEGERVRSYSYGWQMRLRGVADALHGERHWAQKIQPSAPLTVVEAR